MPDLDTCLVAGTHQTCEKCAADACEECGTGERSTCPHAWTCWTCDRERPCGECRDDDPDPDRWLR